MSFIIEDIDDELNDKIEICVGDIERMQGKGELCEYFIEHYENSSELMKNVLFYLKDKIKLDINYDENLYVSAVDFDYEISKYLSKIDNSTHKIIMFFEFDEYIRVCVVPNSYNLNNTINMEI